MERSLVRDLIGLAGFLGLCFGAAALGSLLTTPAISGWYAQLYKPSWNPPDWVFGPVWSILYAMMAVAAWLVWRRPDALGRVPALTLFALQLVLNVCWSGLFFALEAPGAAFAEICLLWLAILATLVAFWHRSVLAGLLMLPYLLWVSFAAFLNFTIWRMNP